MQHILYSQKFKAEKKEEYLKIHREFSLSVLQAYKDAGIEKLFSWYNGTTTYLYFEVDDFETSIAKLSKNEEFKELLEKITPMLDIVQDYSGDAEIPVFEKFFDLEEQIELRKQGK